MSRRERFRAYMARVDPAANPLTAIEQGFYVSPPAAIANQIVGRFEIEPTARQLMVGGIGAGKSTQLLVCAKSLNQIADIFAAYIDVAAHQDLAKVRPGCLLALASEELLKQATPDRSVRVRVSAWVRGYEPGPYDDFEGDESPWRPGILAAPPSDWPSIEQFHVDDLKEIVEAFSATGKHPVLLFDSMDRMSDTAAFSKIVEEDVAALHASGVGVVLVGPVRSLAGFGRLDADRFDHLHVQAPMDIRNDEHAHRFLESVLERRADEEMLPGPIRSELVSWSGGVFRDLMSLAKLAGEEAYLDGAEAVSVVHAQLAADRFGRSLLIGLQPSELATLKQVQAVGRFLQIEPSDVALVATRRVLQYSAGSYAVHPCIAPLLADVPGVPL